jgi:hypothetical protein
VKLMKTSVLVLYLALCAVAVHAQDQQPSSAAAPAVGAVVPVHMAASHVHRCWGTGCPDTVYLEAAINGKKYEPEGMASYGRKSKVPNESVLTPGEYEAKLTKDVENGSGLFFQVYELLLPGATPGKER